MNGGIINAIILPENAPIREIKSAKCGINSAKAPIKIKLLT